MQSSKHSREGRYGPFPTSPGSNTSTLTVEKEMAARESLTASPVYTPERSAWQKWIDAFKNIVPVYVAMHVIFLLLAYCSSLFAVKNFAQQALPLSTLIGVWNQWDTRHYTYIAMHGYTTWWRTAFFPLFPLLERGLAVLAGDAFIAGLIISNLGGLCMLAVLYRLVEEDFSKGQAYRTVLYFSIFPTAFFFVTAYNESLFLAFALLSFYCMRRGHWWIAGLFGLLASLTRSAGLLLFVPFCYEYLRQRHFDWKAIRFDSLSGAGMPVGIGIFALYCYFRFHDLLTFSHAQIYWQRALNPPWRGMTHALIVLLHRSILSFDSIHNVIDLSASLFILTLIVLSFIGPWKFSREFRAYGICAAAFYLYNLLFPTAGGLPLAALSRNMLEVFPAFIVLAAILKKEPHTLYYALISTALLAFMTLQFLTGGWIV